MRGWKKIFHANGNQKKAGVAILVLDKIDFKKRMSQETRKDYIMIRGSIQEDITTVNTYAPNIGVPQYIKQTLTGESGNQQ